jgi:hypothetical protein
MYKVVLKELHSSERGSSAGISARFGWQYSVRVITIRLLYTFLIHKIGKKSPRLKLFLLEIKTQTRLDRVLDHCLGYSNQSGWPSGEINSLSIIRRRFGSKTVNFGLGHQNFYVKFVLSLSKIGEITKNRPYFYTS